MNRRNVTLISIVAVICILATIFAFSSCGEKREKVDLSTATSVSDLAGATIAAQTGTFHLDALNSLGNVNVIIFCCCVRFDSCIVKRTGDKPEKPRISATVRSIQAD